MASTTTPLRRWTKPKLTILETLADLYCATPKDIAEYLKLRTPTLSEVRDIRAKLDRVRDHHPHATYVTKQPYFMRTSLFGLSDAGARRAREIMGIESARSFEIRDLDHEHIITRFHIKARALAIREGWGFAWEQNAIDHKRFINEDAQLTLTIKGKPFVFPVEPERQSFNENHLKKAK